MSKYLYIVLVACLVIMLGLVGYIKQPIKGDVNCDRRVSITDLVIVHLHVVEGEEMRCPGNADMNGDFIIDMKDVEALRNQLAGIDD